MPIITRRHFFAGSAGALLSAGLLPRTTLGHGEKEKVKVAAIQFSPVLGDVAANLEQCRALAIKAVKQGARWIVLPEFFSSGLAMDRKMWDAYRPLNGEPTKLLRHIAQKHGVNIGGSFLAQSGADVFNTFVLATPDGRVQTHDKDFPSTVFESSFYAGGEDDEYVAKIGKDGFTTKKQLILGRRTNSEHGILDVGNLKVGAALCWELVRFRTARRLRGKIDLLLGASGWWWSTPEFGWPGRNSVQLAKSRKQQLALIKEAPRRLARMTGAPVVHANFVGLNHSFANHDFADPAKTAKAARVTGRYLGQSQIVGADGKTVKLDANEQGVVMGEIEVGRRKPLEDIPENEFWMPELSKDNKISWSKSGALGRDFYLTRTRAEIKSRSRSK